VLATGGFESAYVKTAHSGKEETMATRWLPVSESIASILTLPKEAVDISPAVPLIESILDGTQPGLPTTLEDFPALRSNGQWLSRKVAAELGFVVGSATGSYSHNTYVQQLATWIDLPDDSGTAQVRYGISARYVVTAEEIKVGAKLNSIGGIAASASYETVRASAEFSTLGIPASWIIDQVPTGGAFDLNKYVEFEGALRGVLKVLKAKQAETLMPQILEVRGSVSEDGTDQYEDALAVSWALSCVARRLRLSNAKTDYDRGRREFYTIVETIYARVAGVTAPDEVPTKAVGQKAEELLNGLRTEES
jgi:hypothetical protein